MSLFRNRAVGKGKQSVPRVPALVPIYLRLDNDDLIDISMKRGQPPFDGLGLHFAAQTGNQAVIFEGGDEVALMAGTPVNMAELRALAVETHNQHVTPDQVIALRQALSVLSSTSAVTLTDVLHSHPDIERRLRAAPTVIDTDLRR